MNRPALQSWRDVKFASGGSLRVGHDEGGEGHVSVYLASDNCCLIQRVSADELEQLGRAFLDISRSAAIAGHPRML